MVFCVVLHRIFLLKEPEVIINLSHSSIISAALSIKHLGLNRSHANTQADVLAVLNAIAKIPNFNASEAIIVPHANSAFQLFFIGAWLREYGYKGKLALEVPMNGTPVICLGDLTEISELFRPRE